MERPRCNALSCATLFASPPARVSALGRLIYFIRGIGAAFVLAREINFAPRFAFFARAIPFPSE